MGYLWIFTDTILEDIFNNFAPYQRPHTLRHRRFVTMMSRLLAGQLLLLKIEMHLKNGDWLVVSTHVKHICQNGNLHQIEVNIKNI